MQDLWQFLSLAFSSLCWKHLCCFAAPFPITAERHLPDKGLPVKSKSVFFSCEKTNMSPTCLRKWRDHWVGEQKNNFLTVSKCVSNQELGGNRTFRRTRASIIFKDELQTHCENEFDWSPKMIQMQDVSTADAQGFFSQLSEIYLYTEGLKSFSWKGKRCHHGGND